MGKNLPKWSIALLLFAVTIFAVAGENGVNSYTMGWGETHPTSTDVFYGASGPFDYDNDGYPEVVTYSDEGGLTLHMYENVMNDEWTEVWTYNITEIGDSRDICESEVDVDGDGLSELLVGGHAGTDYPASLFIFEVDTAFTNADSMVLNLVASVNPTEEAQITNDDGLYPTSTRSVMATDLDSDGIEEIVLYDGGTASVIVMSLDTLSSFEFPSWNVEFTDGSFCCSVYSEALVGDFDGNGTNNFAMIEWDFNGISFFDVVDVDEYELIYFSDNITEYDGGSKRSQDAADIDGDGDIEIILASTYGTVLLYDPGEDLFDFDKTTDVYTILDYSDMVSFRGAKLGNTDIWHGTADGADYVITTDSTLIIDLEYDGMGDVFSAASWTAYSIESDMSDDAWTDVVLSDFDYDGLDEIFAVTTSSPTVQIFEHDGWNNSPLVGVHAYVSDTLTTPGWQTRGVAAGSDIDQDGRQEVIITDYGISGVHVYEVAGDNTLEWMVSLADDSSDGSSTPRHCIVSDMDGNGQEEISWIQHYTPGVGYSGILAWEWDGVVGSDNYTMYSMPITIASDGSELDRYYGDRMLNVGDPDQDGQQELLISNNGSNNLYDIFMIAHVENTFESGFYTLVSEYEIDQTSDAFGGSPGYGQANVTDLDGDGDLEVCFFAWDHLTLLVVEALGENDYELQTSYMVDSARTDKAVYGTTFVTDMDGDGADEIYGGAYSGARWVWGITAGADGDAADISFENGSIEIISDFGGDWDLTGGDGDGDGVDELYTIGYTHGRIYEWDYNGAGWDMNIVANWEYTMGGFPIDFADDLDGDGYPELVSGYLEPPFSGGNDLGIVFSVAELRGLTGVSEEWTVITPNDFKLGNAYPNPFNPSTTIDFTLPLAKDNVNVIVYNMLGQEVVRLADNASYGPGTHSVTWNSLNANGTPAAAGVYIYELRSGNVSKTAKMTLIK